jgi:putative ABC transport system permease protein
MNIFNKIALHGIKRNRVRTVVTIIGVILSVSMITAVTTLISSLQQSLVESTIADSGSWQVKFIDTDADFIGAASAGGDADVAAIENVGYARLEDGQNAGKPYLFVTGWNDAAFDMLPANLISGRLPKNENELMVPEHLWSNGGVKYEVGDKLTLELGSRVFEGNKLGQETSFVEVYKEKAEDGDANEVDKTEDFESEFERTYTVVGICKRLGFEETFSPGYTAVTVASPPDAGSRFEVFAALKSPGEVYDYAARVGGAYGYAFNSELLRYYGVSKNDNFNAVLYSLGGILIALIMVGSILLIYNSFAISVSERARQFGILSSVGATRKQLRRSVLFEGLCVGIVGIPLGIIAGIGGIGITLRFIDDLFASVININGSLSLHLSLPAIIIAAAVGALTILISAYIPARRAVRKSAIDIIRQSEDIKVAPKTVRTPKFVGRLFGLEGALALKNFRRNRRRYRSTVVSLFVSVVLFISASAFGMYLSQGTELTVGEEGYDISYMTYQTNLRMQDAELLALYDRMKNVRGITQSEYSDSASVVAAVDADKLTERYIDYVMGGEVPSSKIVDEHLHVCFIDDESYARYLEALGFSHNDYRLASGKLPAVARITGYDSSQQRTVDIDILNVRDLTLDLTPDLKTNAIIVDDLPQGFSQEDISALTIFAPYSEKPLLNAPNDECSGMRLTFSSDDPMTSASEMQTIIQEAGSPPGYSLYNAAASREQQRGLLMIINIFTYGFVILISLITIANVFNTVSTSIGLRRREFAMLRSVGMDNRGFNKMMNFECIFYGLKALIYGLPASAIITYVIYKAVLRGVDVSFQLPWAAVLISIFSVFLVVFVTMIYAVSKIKKANVIDALRDEAV